MHCLPFIWDWRCISFSNLHGQVLTGNILKTIWNISNLSGFVWTWSKRRIHVVSFEGGHPLIERAGMFIENVKRNPLLCERLINSWIGYSKNSIKRKLFISIGSARSYLLVIIIWGQSGGCLITNINLQIP